MSSKKEKKPKKDNSGLFWQFCTLCENILQESGLSKKKEIIEDFIARPFRGDVYLLMKLLLIKHDLRVFRMKETSLVKVMAKLLKIDEDDMIEKFKVSGDVAGTIRDYFSQRKKYCKRGTITLKEVDVFLDKLTKIGRQKKQVEALKKFMYKKMTLKEVKYLTLIILKDLKINIGMKYVLDALDSKAYDTYKITNDLKTICERIKSGEGLENFEQSLAEPSDFLGAQSLDELGIEWDEEKDISDTEDEGSDTEDDIADEDVPVKGSRKRKKKNPPAKKKSKKLRIAAVINNAIQPMLCRASKTFKDVLKRCPNGFYAEIKYDGERLQVHKDDEDFKFFSRNLKPTQEYKIKELEEYLLKSTSAKSIILDGEILVQNTLTGQPLPFGTLSKSKNRRYKNCVKCVYFFDILYLNGKSLLHFPTDVRRKILKKNVNVIPNRILISDALVCDGDDEEKEALVSNRMASVIAQKLEGLVLKDFKSEYEPKKRHWLKMKKDYLKGMADSCDLIVVGAYLGKGDLYGGMLKVFLMCCYDEDTKTFKTVCKVGNGHDFATTKRIGRKFRPLMNQIMKDGTQIPDWLEVNSHHYPDFVLKDHPFKVSLDDDEKEDSLVWEIAGAEFSKSDHHPTKISIRFPRVTRIRVDKGPKDSTKFDDLKELYKESKKKTPVALAKLIQKERGGDFDLELSPMKGSGKKKKKKKVKKKKKTKSHMRDDVESDDLDEPMAEKEKPIDEELSRVVENDKLLYTNHPIFKTKTKKKAIIVHLLDDSGKWSNRGTMGYISKFMDTHAQEAYETESVVLGKNVYAEDDENNLHFCNVVCLSRRKRGPPRWEAQKYEECMVSLKEYVEKNEIFEVHVDRPNKSIKHSYYLLRKEMNKLVSNEVKVYLHDRYYKKKKRREKVDAMVDEGEEEDIDEDGGDTEVSDDGGETEEDVEIEGEIGKCFDGFRFFVTGVKKENDEESEKKVKKYKRLVRENGGVVSEKYDVLSTTHCLYEEKTEDMEHAGKMGVICVTPSWIDEEIKKVETSIMRKRERKRKKEAEKEAKAREMFKGCVFYLFNVTDREKYVKFIYIFGGEVVEDINSQRITHFIANIKMPNVSTINPKWLWVCINDKTFYDPTLFYN